MSTTPARCFWPTRQRSQDGALSAFVLVYFEDVREQLCREPRNGDITNDAHVAARLRERGDQGSWRRPNRPGIVFRRYRTVAIGPQRDYRFALDHPVRARFVPFDLAARDSIPGDSTGFGSPDGERWGGSCASLPRSLLAEGA